MPLIAQVAAGLPGGAEAPNKGAEQHPSSPKHIMKDAGPCDEVGTCSWIVPHEEFQAELCSLRGVQAFAAARQLWEKHVLMCCIKFREWLPSRLHEQCLIGQTARCPSKPLLQSLPQTMPAHRVDAVMTGLA